MESSANMFFSEGDDHSHLLEDGKNKLAAFCIRCTSRILNPAVGTFTTRKHDIPVIKKSKGSDVQMENLEKFWQVSDNFAFENIGFTNTVSNLKYLTCADCELGPLGFFDMATKMSYLALSRVKYEQE